MAQGLIFPPGPWSLTAEITTGPVEHARPLIPWTSSVFSEKCQAISQPVPLSSFANAMLRETLSSGLEVLWLEKTKLCCGSSMVGKKRAKKSFVVEALWLEKQTNQKKLCCGSSMVRKITSSVVKSLWLGKNQALLWTFCG